MNKKYLDYIVYYFYEHFEPYGKEFTDDKYSLLMYSVYNAVHKEYPNFENVKNGQVDSLIYNHFVGHLLKKSRKFKADYINLYRYVKNYIGNVNGILYSDETFNFIVSRIAIKLMVSFDSEKLNDGKFDDEIVSTYKQVCSKLRSYISSYIAKMDISLTDLDDAFVTEQVFNLLMNSKDMSAKKLLNGEYNYLIDKLVEENKLENKTKRISKMPNTVAYIKKVVVDNANKVVSVDGYVLINTTKNEELLNKYCRMIDDTLRTWNLNPSEIMSGEYDRDIQLLYNDFFVRGLDYETAKMSIQRPGVPKYINKNSGKKTFVSAVSSLLAAGVLAGAVGYVSYMYAKGLYNEKVKDNLSKIDDYSYSHVNDIHSRNFDAAILNFIETSDEYAKYGEDSYDYISLYRNYLSTNGDLYIMDNMLSEIKLSIKNDDLYQELYGALKGNRSFLGFIYDRLEEMGYEEIRNEEYVQLLHDYEKIRFEMPYDANPVEHLTNSQERLINKVKDIYEKLSNEQWIEFGKLLGTNEKDIEEENSVRRH